MNMKKALLLSIAPSKNELIADEMKLSLESAQVDLSQNS